MHARSAVFDVYGDHLTARGGAAPVASLVRLLAPVGIAAPAVRTAVSRMVAQGWLQPVTLPDGPGYATTPRADRRLDLSRERIYRRTSAADASWDGTWHLVVVTPPAHRSARLRLRADLEFLGYASLAAETWLAPRRSDELDDVLRSAGVEATTATVSDLAPVDRAMAAWDLAGLAADYERWLREVVHTLGATPATDDPDEAAFAVRFGLVHEWRKFLFRDPGLPAVLLPDAWPGHRAAEVFAEHAERLRPGADRFVAGVLGGHDGHRADWPS